MGEKEEKSSYGDVNIGGSAVGSLISTGKMEKVKADIIVSGVTISSQKITIDNAYLEKMPKEYADSLQAFTADLNQHLKDTKVPPEDMKQLQESATDVAKEMVDVKPGVSVSAPKKLTIGMKLSNLAKAVVKACPKFAETIVSMTPLAPFSGLVGTTFEKIVADWLKEKPT